MSNNDNDRAEQRPSNDAKGSTLSSEEKDSIYQFWKDEPGFCLALFSTVIAVCSFAIKAQLNYAKLLNLRYWGITDHNIGAGNDNQLYAIAIIAVGITLLLGTIAFIDSTISAWIYNCQIKRRLKKESEQNMSEAGKSKKNTRRGEQLRRKAGKKSKKEKSNQKTSIIVGFSFLAVFLFWTGLLYCAQGVFIQTSTTNLFIIIVSAISAMILLVLSVAFFAIFYFFYIKKRLENKKNTGRSTLDFEYPINKIASFRLSTYLTNQRIRALALLIVVIIVLVLPISLMFNHIIATNQKEFQIYKDANLGEVYVLIYRNDNTYYFDRAEESDPSSIKVFTNMQRILKADDMVLETVKYENVTVKNDASP